MQIIPVIDLMHGKVVHAKRGNRKHYQALQSTLCDSHRPLTVVAALLKLYPFITIYIADLDAILGLSGHTEIIDELSHAYPAVNFWLDCGISKVNARALYVSEGNTNIRVVIGSENIANLQDYRAISYACESRHVLSLDYSATSALGIVELHQSAHFWPDDAICMTLTAVGNEQGLDIDRILMLNQLNLARKKPAKLYAAGGVRNVDDLKEVKSLGLAGALVATALHNGSLKTSHIDYFNAQKKPN